MDTGAVDISHGLLKRLRIARIRNLDVLESGAYWPLLQPHFRKQQFRRLVYRYTGGSPRPAQRGELVSTRGASGLGPLDVAYVADRFATAMAITETGLPDYCITSVVRGSVALHADATPDPVHLNWNTGAIYCGRPGTRLQASDDHQRLSVWVPAPELDGRLAALLGEPGRLPLTFSPSLDWRTGPGAAIQRLLQLLINELESPCSFALNDIARQSFIDLLLYSLLQGVPNSHTDRLSRRNGSPVPRVLHRAEAFIRSRTGQPIALHEVALAAGCSVRTLQLGFRRFRDTTPAAAIRHARLEAAHQALSHGEIEGTVHDVAQRFGFTHPGRFTALYKAAFGISPALSLARRPQSDRTARPASVP